MTWVEAVITYLLGFVIGVGVGVTIVMWQWQRWMQRMFRR